MKDRWRGFLSGLKEWEFDHFTDHSIMRYIECILRAVNEEESFERRLLSIKRPPMAPVSEPRRRAA